MTVTHPGGRWGCARECGKVKRRGGGGTEFSDIKDVFGLGLDDKRFTALFLGLDGKDTIRVRELNRFSGSNTKQNIVM